MLPPSEARSRNIEHPELREGLLFPKKTKERVDDNYLCDLLFCRFFFRAALLLFFLMVLSFPSRQLRQHVNYFPPFIISAVRAHAVRHNKPVTMRAGNETRCSEGVMRPAPVSSRFCMTLFGNRHEYGSWGLATRVYGIEEMRKSVVTQVGTNGGESAKGRADEAPRNEHAFHIRHVCQSRTSETGYAAAA